MHRTPANIKKKDTVYRPPVQQELLLRAALLQGEEAVESWSAWRKTIDLDSIDHESQMLLPMLYKNLTSLGINDPEMSKYQGIQRKTWAKNHMVLHETAVLLRMFQAAGIETLLLKGSAMILKYYPDYGLRPMEDVDILVPVEKAKKAIEILNNAGWKRKKNSGAPFNEKYPNVNKANQFENARGFQIDLHWHLLHECSWSGGDADFWQASVPVKIGNMTVNVLNPADQLFHLNVHAMRWNPQPLMRWAADAMMVMKQEENINWERIISLAKSMNLVLPVKNGLTYLHDKLGAPIPEHVLDEISKINIAPIEYREFYHQNHSNILFDGLVQTWFRYRRVEHRKPFLLSIPGFLKFLRYSMEVNHRWQLPGYIVLFGMRRIKASIHVKPRHS